MFSFGHSGYARHRAPRPEPAAATSRSGCDPHASSALRTQARLIGDILIRHYLTLTYSSDTMPAMEQDGRRTWSLAELAAEAGVSPRTIRYYIARGLLDGPVVAGRGAAYTEDHLARLKKIRELQARGLMLAEIRLQLAGGRAAEALQPADSWDRYPIAEDVAVWVRRDIAPWRSRTIARALAEFAAKTKRNGNHDHNDRRH